VGAGAVVRAAVAHAASAHGWEERVGVTGPSVLNVNRAGIPWELRTVIAASSGAPPPATPLLATVRTAVVSTTVTGAEGGLIAVAIGVAFVVATDTTAA